MLFGPHYLVYKRHGMIAAKRFHSRMLAFAAGHLLEKYSQVGEDYDHGTLEVLSESDYEERYGDIATIGTI